MFYKQAVHLSVDCYSVLSGIWIRIIGLIIVLVLTLTLSCLFLRIGEHNLPNSFVYLLIPGLENPCTLMFISGFCFLVNSWHVVNPTVMQFLPSSGLFSNHAPLYFAGTKRFFSKMGLACHIAKIHSEVITFHLVLYLD